MIFDYINRGGFDQSEFARLDEGAHWHPVEIDTIARTLQVNGWHEDQMRIVHDEYERWYAELVKRIEEKREAIVALAGEEAYRHTHRVYQTLLETIQREALGGAIIFARATELK